MNPQVRNDGVILPRADSMPSGHDELQNVAYDYPESLTECIGYHASLAADPAQWAEQLLRALTSDIPRVDWPARRFALTERGLEGLWQGLATLAGLQDRPNADVLANQQPPAAPDMPAAAGAQLGLQAPSLRPRYQPVVSGTYAQMLRAHEARCHAALQEARDVGGGDADMIRRLVSAKVRLGAVAPNAPVVPPRALRCPISRELFYDPVLCEDGKTYERRYVQDAQIFASCYAMRAVADAWRTFEKGPVGELSEKLAQALKCSFTQEMLEEPITLSDGFAYEKEACLTYLGADNGDRSPTHRNLLARPGVYVVNETVRAFIQQMSEDPRFTEFKAEVGVARYGDQQAQGVQDDAAAAEAVVAALAFALLNLTRPVSGFLAEPSNVESCLLALSQMEQLRAQRTWYSIRDNRQFSQLADALLRVTSADLAAVPIERLAPVTLFLYGEVMRLTGNTQRALEVYSVLQDFDPILVGPCVFGRAALVQIAAGDEETALILARGAIDVNPNDAHAYAALGEMLYRHNDFIAAKNSLEESLRLQPTREARQSLRRVNGRRRGM